MDSVVGQGGEVAVVNEVLLVAFFVADEVECLAVEDGVDPGFFVADDGVGRQVAKDEP